MKIEPRLPVGEKLKKYREAIGIRSHKFAKDAEVDGAHYYKIENGLTFPGYHTLLKLISYYKIDPRYLFDFRKKGEGNNGNGKKKRTGRKKVRGTKSKH